MSRKRRGKIEVSLFPFLSVLVSMIGVFMLFLIAIVSTRAIGAAQEQRGRGAAQGPQPVAAQDNTEGDIMDEGIDEATYNALAQQIERLAAELAQRQKERDELVKLETELIDLIAAKEDEIQLVPLAARTAAPGHGWGRKRRCLLSQTQHAECPNSRA